jgi:hypothetical protein
MILLTWSQSDLSFLLELPLHVRQQFDFHGESSRIVQRAQKPAQGSLVQPMLGLHKILKGRAHQNVLLQSPRKPRMQIHQQPFRQTKTNITTLALLAGFGSAQSSVPRHGRIHRTQSLRT